MEITIRSIRPSDHTEIEYMTREAFWNLYVPGCNEHYLVHVMRKHQDYIPEMEFIAVYEEKIVGSIIYTKSFLLDENDNKIETLSFGPLCVRPEFQRKGIGTKLISFTKKIAETRNCPGIFIYGDPHNYCKNGFRNGKDYNISDQNGKYPYGLLALILKKQLFENGNKYRLYQSEVFNLDLSKIEEYDKQFPEKKKEYQYSQELFSIAIRAFLI